MGTSSDEDASGEDLVASVRAWYATTLEEHDRLDASPASRLEARRTRALLASRLPAPPSALLDVGGATGAYASWLRDLGHEVTLVDLVDEHVERARSRGLEAVLADARELDVAAASMDAVLLMGPLYHLVDRADRMQVIERAHRIVRPGGLVVAAAINRWTSLLHLASIGTWDDGLGAWTEDVARRLSSAVRSGVHDPEVSFTSAYTHRSDELADELTAAGLVDVEVLAVEGPLGHVIDHLPDPEAALDRAFTVAETTEHEPLLAGASLHLLGFARRPP